MKVLMIVSSYAPNVGGLQSVTRQLAKELHARGHEVVVITNRYPRTLPAREVVDGVQVIRWHFLAPQLRFLLNLRFDLFLAGFLYLPLTLARLVLLLRRERPDLVNLHFVGAPALFVLLARWFRSFRLVVSMHGDDVEGLPGRGRFDRRVFRALMQRADAITACSHYLLAKAIEFESSIGPKGRAVYNGLEPPAVLSRHEQPGGMVAAGRMVPKKGFDVLVRAQAQSQIKSPLSLIGDGPEREALGELARSLGLNGEVRFHGQQDRPQVLEAMAAADLVVIPSRQEPFGLVALEAMALGKPVVASRVGGLPEVLEGAEAVFVRPDDANELREAIESVRARLRTDPTFGARNRKLAARFSVARMVDGYLQTYQARREVPLRVALVHPFLFRYGRGIERYTFNLANALARRGNEVHLITWNWRQSVRIDEIDSRVTIHRLPTSRYFAAKAIVPFYTRHLLKHRYDFVWIAFAGCGEAESLRLARGQRFGIVFHYPAAQVPHRYREFKRYGLIDRAERIVSVSQYVADGVREFFGRESEVIHHGVDTERFKPDEERRRAKRKELGLRDAPVLVTAAALEERKGIQWVLRALPKIRERFPNIIYLVLGGGAYRDALEQLAADLGVQSCVRFLGAQQDVTPFYQAADVSLILSRGEASSLTALESLACEVPVIAARRPPFDELIPDDCGMLVDEEDTDAVAGAVEGMLANPEQRALMGQRGRALLQEKFSWERAAEEYIKVMESAR